MKIPNLANINLSEITILTSKMFNVSCLTKTKYKTQRQQKYKLFINQSTYKAGGLMQAY